jgi:hypothetical protein
MVTEKIIQAISSIYDKGIASDDSRLSQRQIFNRMVPTRGRLLVQQANKRQKISQWSYQTLPCVEMIKAQPYECPCVPPVGCGIYRSKYPLPEPVTGINNHLIQSVTSLDGTTIYSETSWEEKKYKAGNRYTSHMPDYFIRNSYLYITADKMFNKVIPVTGLFNDPVEAWDFMDSCNEGCTDCDDCLSYLEREFPLDENNVDTMIRLLQQELISPFVQMREDRTSNTADSDTQTSK